MKQHIVKVKSISPVTHDVLKIVTEKPENFHFIPGQATGISINKPDWDKEKRPFTFTCLPTADYLEFVIKTYPLHKGVTNELLQLKPKDELILHDVFGAINYKDEGLFIAGGAGITPFISIFRYLQSVNKIGDNKLLFANKTKGDIILEQEFKTLLGKNFINILADEKADGYLHGHITKELIEKTAGTTNNSYYLCGPPPMMDAIEKQLAELNIAPSSIVKETF